MNNSFNYEELREQLKEVPGFDEFLGLLEMPDSIFDAMYPELKREIAATVESAEIRSMIQEVISSPEYSQIDISGLINQLKEIKGISKNKLDLLILLFSIFEELFDAKIDVQIINDATLPTYANLGDAGMDIYAAANMVVPSGATVIIPTGLKVAIPYGWMLSIRPRSGMSKKTKIRISNTPGTVDCGYRDEIGILVDNYDMEDYEIKKGDRIAQFILERAYTIKWNLVDDVSTIGTNRGGGFGSTGS